MKRMLKIDTVCFLANCKSHRKCYGAWGMRVAIDLQFAGKGAVPILSNCCIKYNSTYKIGFSFLAGTVTITEFRQSLSLN
jgi:hypothetical protein